MFEETDPNTLREAIIARQHYQSLTSESKLQPGTVIYVRWVSRYPLSLVMYAIERTVAKVVDVQYSGSLDTVDSVDHFIRYCSQVMKNQAEQYPDKWKDDVFVKVTTELIQ